MPGPDAATVTSDVFLGLLPAELTGKPSMERFAVRPVRMIVGTCAPHKRLTCVHAERCQPFIAHLCWEANGVGSRVAATISQEIKAGEYVSTLKPLFRGALYRCRWRGGLGPHVSCVCVCGDCSGHAAVWH